MVKNNNNMSNSTSDGASRAAILGATSAVAQSVAQKLAQEGDSLLLVARNEEKLAVVNADLQARGADCVSKLADLGSVDSHAELEIALVDCNVYYIFYGSLPDQEACEGSFDLTNQAMQTNFMSVISLLTLIANICDKRGYGSIVVVSSVAGDRGRKSNYIYGTAKGAVSLFCQGLRNRLAAKNIQVLTVKPGFIDTPMTADIEKKPAVLWATPGKVAVDIVKAQKRGKDVLYTPWFWQWILLIIKLIPERIFKRLSL